MTSYDPEQRFRVYLRDPDPTRDPVCVLSAATPEALGLGLVTVASEHVDHLGRMHPPVGILDTLTRKWLISLWPSQVVRVVPLGPVVRNGQ